LRLVDEINSFNYPYLPSKILMGVQKNHYVYVYFMLFKEKMKKRPILVKLLLTSSQMAPGGIWKVLSFCKFQRNNFKKLFYLMYI